MSMVESAGTLGLACCHHRKGQGSIREKEPDMTGSRADRFATIGFVFFRGPPRGPGAARSGRGEAPDAVGVEPAAQPAHTREGMQMGDRLAHRESGLVQI